MVVHLLVFLAAAQAAAPAPSDEIKDALTRAESFYYEARFNESIQVLARVNETLRTKPDRVQDRISADLQLALAHIGLNDVPSAKTYLTEIYALNPDFGMDRQQFSPKVLTLADEAKTEQQKARCTTAMSDARKHLASDNVRALLDLSRSMKPRCADLSTVELEAADSQYKKGLAEYKQGEYHAALRSFQLALNLAPKHDLAAQYLDLTQNKVQVDLDRLFLQWQKNFEARQFPDAAADYRQLVAMNGDADSPLLNRAAGEYRKALSGLVQSWEKTCAAGDTAALGGLQSQITTLIPEPSFGEDLRSKVGPCAPKETKPEVRPATQVAANIPAPPGSAEPKANATTECLQMDAPIALIRLKNRVEPEITREMRSFLQNSGYTVRAKIHIDENGGVRLVSTAGANVMFNNSVKAAVTQWKFTPAKDTNGPRCVEAEIPIVFGK